MGIESENLYMEYNNLAMEAYAQEDYEKALSFWQKSIENLDEDLKISDISKKIVGVLVKLGDVEFENENPVAAIDYYKTILDYNTDDWSLYYYVGNHLNDLGSYNLALDFLKKAISINPEHLDSYFLIGYIYYQYINDDEEALYYFKKYVEKEPNDAKVYFIIAHLYKRLDYYGYLNEQMQYFKKALELMPDSKDVQKSLAFAYLALEKPQEATHYFEKSFDSDTSANEYFIYGCQKLKLGEFEQGWKNYECRFIKDPNNTQYPVIDSPKWEGQPISDKTLLVHYEQGFGDSIQFLRYLQKVKPLAKKVIFRVQDGLVDLFKINAPGIEIVAKSTPITEFQFDCYVFMMDLVRLLDNHLDKVPFSEGYIIPDASKVEKYKKEFFDNSNFKIGISWHGAANGNCLRDIPLDAFYSLAKLKNVKVYSFQKGVGSEKLEDLPLDVEIFDLGKTFIDFSDTAAAMANLDLFISSDNGVFNLAGAMGKKAFLLLNKPSDWRWFFDEEFTRWYDNVRIVKKQDKKEDWDSLIARVIEKI